MITLGQLMDRANDYAEAAIADPELDPIAQSLWREVEAIIRSLGPVIYGPSGAEGDRLEPFTYEDRHRTLVAMRQLESRLSLQEGIPLAHEVPVARREPLPPSPYGA